MTSEERNFATFAHLAALSGYLLLGIGWIAGPLIIWMIKKDDMPFVAQQGKEAVNFNISMFIYWTVLSFTICIGIGVIILPLLGLAHIILIVIAAMKANSGEAYRYPVTIRFIS